jgi:hypothetical protein
MDREAANDHWLRIDVVEAQGESENLMSRKGKPTDILGAIKECDSGGIKLEACFNEINNDTTRHVRAHSLFAD